MRVEDKHLDILQNIEFVIMAEFRKDRSLADQDVFDALKLLIRQHEAELESRPAPNAPLSTRARKVYDAASAMCEWILGRPTSLPLAPAARPPVSTELLVRCLKRIRSSVDFWSKEQGRQGYLTYVSQFVK